MDWISKIEDEDRRLAQAEFATQQVERERRLAEIAAFQVAKDRIFPRLERTIAEVKGRLGIDLRLDLAEIVLTVSSPKRKGSLRQASHPYRFEISDFNLLSSTVRVRVLADGRIYRNSRPPEGVSNEEHYGRDEVIVDARSDLDQFATSGLPLLLQWLVRAHREGGTPNVPQIGAAHPLNILQQAKHAATSRVRVQSRFLQGPRRLLRRIAAPAFGRRGFY